MLLRHLEKKSTVPRKILHDSRTAQIFLVAPQNALATVSTVSLRVTKCRLVPTVLNCFRCLKHPVI